MIDMCHTIIMVKYTHLPFPYALAFLIVGRACLLLPFYFFVFFEECSSHRIPWPSEYNVSELNCHIYIYIHAPCKGPIKQRRFEVV
uniref:Uncharacterized protein n=1 Tax=Rhizophora mucronata TaxID=61149 RepID=A0A2P2KZ50_RHIMU